MKPQKKNLCNYLSTLLSRSIKVKTLLRHYKIGMVVGFKLLLAVGKGTLPLLSCHMHVAELLIRLKICVSVGSSCSALISNNFIVQHVVKSVLTMT